MSVTQAELESYLWGAATVLRGTIDAGDYKQFIFPLLFFKRISDVWDEEYEGALDDSEGDVDYASFAENHRFQMPDGARWQDVRAVTTNVGQRLQGAFRAIEKANPDKLYGAFGDAQWTNKDRLSDDTLRDLIEHFSAKTLSTAHVPEDQFGQAYEYLIKRFADDSGHTAQEFYTNRTLVHLMTLILDPQPGESVYDPTCGTGGMLLSAAVELQRQGKEHRNLKLFGQELNLMSSSIARMNLFLHGIVDFDIERGNTLSQPRFLEGDRLQQFDVVLANPPYSIKQWDRQLWSSDAYGRNRFGTPPQGRADYAFFQHILASMKSGTGRCAILFPHGVLFRNEEREMRKRIIEADLIDCVLGLGPGLFYNSPMEACVVFCRTDKPAERKGKVLFINAVDELVRGRASAHLSSHNIGHIHSAYAGAGSDSSLSKLVDIAQIAGEDYNLSIPLYVSLDSPSQGAATDAATALPEAVARWRAASLAVRGDASDGGQPGTFTDVGRSWPARTDCWQSLRFGDVVKNVNAAATDPAAEGLERYVGLDDIDPRSLRVRRYGNVSDGTTFTRKFQAGQVLFGKRRAYQRKAGVPDFDGVCSGDLLVFAPLGQGLREDLLPFLVQTDAFFEHAIRTSAGSLSPRTKWSALADFHFLAPPADDQARISDVLHAVEAALHATEDAAHAALQFAEAFRAEVFSTDTWGRAPLGQLARRGPQSGLTVPKQDREGPVGMVNMGELFAGEVVPLGGLETVRLPDRALGSHLLSEGDLLFARRSIVAAGAGMCSLVPAHDGPVTFESSIVRVSPDPVQVIPRFLLHYFRSRPGERAMRAITRLGAVAGIAGSDLRNLEIPVPSMERQASVVDNLDEAQERARRIADDADALTCLRQALQRESFRVESPYADVH